MGIYKLSFKNLRRNRLRNIFAILRITLGVVIFLVLISSGLGLNTFLKQANSFNGGVNGNNSQSIISSITDQINSLLGANLGHSEIATMLKNLINNAVYIVDLLASIVFLVGILDILNTMGFNLNGRKREIAIIKTMGFSKRQILLSISLEAGFLGFFGSIGGVLLGSIGLIVLSWFIGISISTILPVWLISGIVTMTTVLSMILGLLPGLFASNIDVVGGLDHE